jgi:hypothetical protein
MKFLIAAVIACARCTAPCAAAANKSEELISQRRPSYVAMGSGAAIFSVAYGVFAAAASSPSHGWQPMIPIVGPFLVGGTWLRDFGRPCAEPFCEFNRFAQLHFGLLAIVDGVAQVAGLSLIIGGAIVRERVWIKAPQLSVRPYSGPGGGGVVVAGSF